jgi:sugar phosphate isomerase/epimerase
MKRRTFIKSTSLLTGAALVSQLERPLMAMSMQDTNYKDTIGLQLWTVRNQMEEDKKGTLKAIADAGYKQVELMDTTHAKELLPICKDLGLKITSSFMDWQAICVPDADGSAVDEIVAHSKEAGLKHVVFGYIHTGHRETVDQFKKHAEMANIAGEKCKAAGMKLCYHNHSFEFEKLKDDQTGFDVLIDEFDKELVPFELDVFWAKIGGWDPIETLRKLDGRVSQVHLKDLKEGTPVIYDNGAVPHEAFKELGAGTIDMAEVLKVSAEIGVEQCHIEQDQSPDPIASIGQSIKHLNTL